MKYFQLVFFAILILCSFHSFAQDVEKYLSLTENWQLDSISRSNKVDLKLHSYKPLYILFTNYSTDINTAPASANPNNVVPEPIDYNATELVFQISFKTKMLQDVFGDEIGGDIWGAYTQSSRWQLYNNELSRPFRETNYQPEVFIIFGTPYRIGSLEGVFVGMGLNHQSNGRSNPLSRSWNRIIFQAGWEIEKLQIVFRPWVRLPEDEENDDNPDIDEFMGRAELNLNYTLGKHDFELATRHSLRKGNNSHGSARLDYSYRVVRNLKIHAQVFTGYGESLIDYNHKQTTFGVGLSLY